MKQYRNLTEICSDMYVMLSALKNTTGFDEESDLIEKAMHMLLTKADQNGDSLRKERDESVIFIKRS